MPLMDMDFAIICPLVRHRMPPIRFLSIGPRLCSTLLSDPASRQRPCASLGLHLHQVVQGTFTLELSNMLGTQMGDPGRQCRGPQATYDSTCTPNSLRITAAPYRMSTVNCWASVFGW